MSFRKYVIGVAFCLFLQASAGFGVSPLDTAIAASPMSEHSADGVSPAQSTLLVEAAVPFPAKELAIIETGSFDSIALLLPSNGNGKKNKHNSQVEDQGNSEDHGKVGEHGGKSVSVQLVFGERDRQVIREYCSQPSSSLPPGLAKRGGQLPPGLEKQLRRNGQLPPGLQKKVERFPVELERRLPPLPANYARVYIGGRGLIVDAQFNIVDVIDLFR
jgi:hypothetical protein